MGIFSTDPRTGRLAVLWVIEQSETQTTDTEMTATTFPKFLLLPPELRTQLWEEAIADKLSTVVTHFPITSGIDNGCIKHMNWHYTKTNIRWCPIGRRKFPKSSNRWRRALGSLLLLHHGGMSGVPSCSLPILEAPC